MGESEFKSQLDAALSQDSTYQGDRNYMQGFGYQFLEREGGVPPNIAERIAYHQAEATESSLIYQHHPQDRRRVGGNRENENQHRQELSTKDMPTLTKWQRWCYV